MYSVHDCSEELKNAKLKATPARLAILKILESHEKPVDSSHFINDHKELGVDRVTVFRILNSFVSKGLVRKLDFQEGKARFETSKDDHHHLICEKCGSIEKVSQCGIGDIENSAINSGFLVRSHNLEFFGFCKKCQT